MEKLREFMRELGKKAQSPGAVYLTGGATALLLRLREQTIDVDLKLDPEPKGVFEAIAELKDRLEINVELAAPSDFIPVSGSWKTNSIFVEQFGPVRFYHFDLAAQALSKTNVGTYKIWRMLGSFCARPGFQRQS